MTGPAIPGTVASLLVAALLPGLGACGLIGPSCNDETGGVFRVTAEVAPGGIVAHTVVSPKSSNQVMRLTWGDTAATLGLSATSVDCGGHPGCALITATPSFGPGGSSPVAQPWPAGLREMQVDGWKGKTWRVEITGDAIRAATYRLDVTYKIACES